MNRKHKTMRKLLFALIVALAPSVSHGQASAPSSDPLLRQDSQGNFFHSKRIIVKPKAGSMRIQAANFCNLRGDHVIKKFNHLDDIQVIEVPEGIDPVAFCNEYSNSGFFEIAELDYMVKGTGITPDDLSYNLQYHLDNTGQTLGTVDADIDAPEAWSIRTDADSIVVAVVDSGVRYTHTDLAANMWTNPGEIPGNYIDDDGNGYIDDIYGIDGINGDTDPIDDHGHGTHVAGIIGAVGNNNNGTTGVAWNVQLMALKFLGTNNSGPISGAIECINYAIANGADIINNSWVGVSFSSTLSASIDIARDLGIILVCSAGNDTSDNDATAKYPASYSQDNIVAVAATDHRDELAGFSNWGANSVDIAAPGVSIYSTTFSNDSSYGYLSGTSMAAPVVSGSLALLKAQYPLDTYLELIDRMYATVDALPNLDGIVKTGGRLNLAAALHTDALFSQDIGNVGVAGSTTSISSSEYIILGSGTAGVNATSDEFHFAYRQLRGDGEIVARVSILYNTDPWAKAGVMIRESLDADSANVAAYVTPANGVRYQVRGATGAATLDSSGSASTAPRWLRVVRQGVQLTAFESADGINWTQIGISTMLLPTEIYFGLAVTSNHPQAFTVAAIDNVSITEYPVDGVDLTINPGNAVSFIESHPNQPGKIQDVGGGTIGWIQNDTWFAFDQFEFSNSSTPSSFQVELEVSKGNSTNANIELRLGSETGQLVADIPVTNTGGWTTFETITASLNTPLSGPGSLYFVFTGDPGFLMDVKSVKLRSDELNILIEGEDFDSESHPNTGNPISVLGIPGGGQKVGFITGGSWIQFNDVSFGGYTNASETGGFGIELTYSSNASFFPNVEVRLDSPTGQLLTTIFIYPTGGWNNFLTLPRNFDSGQIATGTRDLYLVFQGSGFLLDVDSIKITD